MFKVAFLIGEASIHSLVSLLCGYLFCLLNVHVTFYLFIVGLGFPQGIPGARPVVAPAGIRPPIQTYMPSQIDAAVQPGQQKPRMPGLDNYVVDQISKDKQSTERPEHQEATDSGKKVVSSLFLFFFFILILFVLLKGMNTQ